jgi:inorganic pyrophosphatase
MSAISKLRSFDGHSILNVVVETAGGSRCKLDYEEKTSLFTLGKILPSGFEFPFDFGFVPNTLAEDGDPLDVMLIAEAFTATGCLVQARAVGIVEVEQKPKGKKAERNDRVLAIPLCSRMYAGVEHGRDLPQAVLKQIEHFLTTYGAFDETLVRVLRYRGPRVAHTLIRRSISAAKRQKQ